MDNVIIAMLQIEDAVYRFIYNQVGACISCKESGRTRDHNERFGRRNFVQLECHLAQGNAPVIQFITMSSTCRSAHQGVVIDVFIGVQLYSGVNAGKSKDCNQKYPYPILRYFVKYQLQSKRSDHEQCRNQE